MCMSCVVDSLGEVTEDGRTFRVWPVITDHMREVARLVSEFYELPGMSVGGPLHCELDDFNLEDHWFRPDEGGPRYDTETFAAHLSQWSNTVYLAMVEGDDGMPRSPLPSERPTTTEERETALRYCCAIVWGLGTLSEPERHVAVALGHGMFPEYDGDQRELIAINGRPIGVSVTITADDSVSLAAAIRGIPTGDNRPGAHDLTFNGHGYSMEYRSTFDGDGGSSMLRFDGGELDLGVVEQFERINDAGAGSLNIGIRRAENQPVTNDLALFAEEFTQVTKLGNDWSDSSGSGSESWTPPPTPDDPDARND